MDYNDIVNSSHDVLVEFYASWCPHCQHMMPIVAQIKELLSDHLDVVQFDIDDYSLFASEAGVSSVPTFILYQDGKEIWRQTGEMTGEALLTSMQEKLQAIGN